MSHDQKPARVKIVANAGDAAARRRNDSPPARPIAPPASAQPPERDGTPTTRGATIISTLLFLGAAAAGAIAVTLAIA